VETDLVHCEVQTSEKEFRSWASPSKIRGGPTGSVTGFSHSISVWHAQYHSTSAPNPLHLSTVLYPNDKREKAEKLQTKQYSFGYLRNIANESTFTLLLFFKGLGYVKPITMNSYKNNVFA
jgi:hypothetical protein